MAFYFLSFFRIVFPFWFSFFPKYSKETQFCIEYFIEKTEISPLKFCRFLRFLLITVRFYRIKTPAAPPTFRAANPISAKKIPKTTTNCESIMNSLQDVDKTVDMWTTGRQDEEGMSKVSSNHLQLRVNSNLSTKPTPQFFILHSSFFILHFLDIPLLSPL